MRNSRHSVFEGQLFGHLRVIGPSVHGGEGYYFPCMCSCGRPTFALYTRLMAGAAKSCGCEKGNRTHGFRRTRLYSIWGNIKQRCYNSNNAAFVNYGGRGIGMHEEWARDFKAFNAWAHANGYTDDMTIERLDVDGNYEPGNCSWIPKANQASNRRSTIWREYQGETKNLKEWSRDVRCTVKYHTLYTRIRNGWDMPRAMTTPAATKGGEC